MIIILCDCCGKKIGESNSVGQFVISKKPSKALLSLGNKKNTQQTETMYQLCSKCAEETEKFLVNRRQKNQATQNIKS